MKLLEIKLKNKIIIHLSTKKTIRKQLDKNGFLGIDFYKIFIKYMIIVNKEWLQCLKMKSNNMMKMRRMQKVMKRKTMIMKIQRKVKQIKILMIKVSTQTIKILTTQTFKKIIKLVFKKQIITQISLHKHHFQNNFKQTQT